MNWMHVAYLRLWYKHNFHSLALIFERKNIPSFTKTLYSISINILNVSKFAMYLENYGIS